MCRNDERLTLLVGMESRLLIQGCILSRKEREHRRRGLMDWGKEVGQSTGVLRSQRSMFLRALEGEDAAGKGWYIWSLKF